MDLLKIFIISAIPLIEQRGAIPVGIIIYGINPLAVFIVSFLGSLFPVPFVLLLFNTIFSWMKRYRYFRIINSYIERKLDKGTKKVEKYKELGLLIFVAIPLPTTGLWTGSAIASFLNMDFKKSFIFVALGGVISAVVITIISVVFPALLGY
jgi:uncharacterized membrane protein